MRAVVPLTVEIDSFESNPGIISPIGSRNSPCAGLSKMARAVVDCAGVGVCTSDYGQLQFNKVRRPIYPLDLPNR